MNLNISRNGVEIGAWPEEDVVVLYREGQLLRSDYYWKPGMSEWALLSQFVTAPPPPTPQPTALPDALPHPSSERLWLWGVLYVILSLVMSGIAATNMDPASMLGVWFSDVAIAGIVWVIYKWVAKPKSRRRSFLVFAGISMAFFIFMLLGKFSP